MKNNQALKLVIVGGGITGLSAAYYAQKMSREKGLPLHVTLLEQGPSLGGKIQTAHRDGFIIERGPDSFLARKMPIIELSQELGLAEEWAPTNPKAKKTYILYQNKLHRMPPGLMLGIPTELLPFMQTGLVSFTGKMRAGMDLVIKKRKETDDESLGHFLERRLGKEVVANIAEPLLSGIYAGDAYALSLQATFPQFQALEQNKRSLILGMLSSKKQTQQSTALPDIAKKSMFLSFKNGLSSLVDRLQEACHEVDIQCHTTVNHVEPIDSPNKGYTVHVDHSAPIEADAVIMTTPPYVTAKQLPACQSKTILGNIPHATVASVVLTFNKTELGLDLDGAGFVVPRKEGRTITACTWTSSKWGHVAPEDKVLLRAYVGRAGEEDIVHQADETIIARVVKDLNDIIGLEATPLFTQVNRWIRSMPQYPIGHKQNIQFVHRELEQHLPGLYVCGAGYEGVGLPDCIGQGKQAATKALSHLL